MDNKTDEKCGTCTNYVDDGVIAFMGVCTSPPPEIDLIEVSTPSAFYCNKWEASTNRMPGLNGSVQIIEQCNHQGCGKRRHGHESQNAN